MDNRTVILSSIVALSATIISYFFNKTVSAGIMLGAIFSYLYLRVLTFSMKSMLTLGKTDTFLIVIGKIIRMILLAVPLLLGALFPEKINIFGSFAGEMILKICLYAENIFKLKKH